MSKIGGNKVVALIKKELHSYFSSPIAYLILITCLSLFNILFFMIVDQNKEVSLRDVFQVMEFMFIFIIPLLTMKLFAEEKSNGTMEFLLTAPLTPMMIVLGKYLSMLVFYSVLIILTGIYYFIVEYFGNPDAFSILSGYIGIWLEGAFFIAIGLLTSSWTRNQIRGEIQANISSENWVYTLNGKVVGYIFGWITQNKFHLHNIAVHPDHLRKKMARNSSNI